MESAKAITRSDSNPQLEEEVRKRAPFLGQALDLGGDHHDPPDHRDDPDEQERLGRDLAARDDELQCENPQRALRTLTES